MDLLREVYDLKETVGHKIAQANKKIKTSGGDIANDDVEIIDKLTHSLKSLVTTCAMLEAEDGEYSATGPLYYPVNTGYSGRRGEMRDDGYSRNGRGNNGGYSRNGYSRGNRYGYSTRTEDMTEQLIQMMEDAPDEMTRMEIKKLVDKMENQR